MGELAKAMLIELNPILRMWTKMSPSGASSATVKAAIKRVMAPFLALRQARDVIMRPLPFRRG